MTQRTALLIDLDNVTITREGPMPALQAEDLLRSITFKAGPADWTMAVAPRRTVVRYGPTLARLGIRWELVPCTPDSADARIVDLATDLSKLGYDEFVIASGDGYFAGLARIGRLRVITRTGQAVSRRLRAAAVVLDAA